MKTSIAVLLGSFCLCAGAVRGHKLISLCQGARTLPPPVEMTAQQDHQRMMELLRITSLRPGADPNNPHAPNTVNYDEAKANPYPNLPDPLVMKNGKRVTTAKVWWNQRRAEIVEDFDREIYGRVPANTPKVKWEVTATTNEVKYDVPVITKQLVGHVDNSAYPLITVDIQWTLTTPANVTSAVPVILEFGFTGRRPPGPPAGNAPSWQQQLLAKGWGYAVRQHSGGHTTGPNWPTFLAFASRYIRGRALRR